MSAVAALEGRSEVEMVRAAAPAPGRGQRRGKASPFATEVSEARLEAMTEVNAYFKRVLSEVPTIKKSLMRWPPTQRPDLLSAFEQVVPDSAMQPRQRPAPFRGLEVPEVPLLM